MTLKDYYFSILKEELVPALGCTEPIALAFAAAACRKILGEEAEYISASCSSNIIKNVKGVTVPNCGGLKGIDTAVSAGMLFCSPEKNLNVLEDVKPEDVIVLKEYIDNHKIDVCLLESNAKLHFIITMKNKEHSAEVEVIHQHTNIVRKVKDGEVLFSTPFDENDFNESTIDRSKMSVEGILEFANMAESEELALVLESQIKNNWEISNEGLENSWGAEVGKTILDSGMFGKLGRVEALAAAGSDARMSGCSMPVVINSGSGNQGITVSVPVIEYARDNNIPYDRLLRALAISNLLAIYQKNHIGRLSAYCGAVCAACGAGAAITWLAGGKQKQIEETIVNTLATVSGMVCDGAKPSCAGKIAVAVNAAYIAHVMAMSDKSYKEGDGIVKSSVEETVSGVGKVARDGMRDTDSVILSVMLDK